MIMNPLIFDSLLFLLTWFLHTVFAISGLGGGIILVPTYVTLGITLSIAATAGLLMNIISLSIVTLHNSEHRIIRWKLGIIFLVPAIIMAPVGEIASSMVPRSYVLILFIVLLIYAFFHIIQKRKETHRELLVGRMSAIFAGPIGIIAGFLSGLTGIGGGLIILPALTFMEDDYRKIAGTTAFVALFISVSSFISHFQYLDQISTSLWIIILSGSILGGISASYLLHVLGSRKISIITGTVIIALTVLLSLQVA